MQKHVFSICAQICVYELISGLTDDNKCNLFVELAEYATLRGVPRSNKQNESRTNPSFVYFDQWLQFNRREIKSGRRSEIRTSIVEEDNVKQHRFKIAKSGCVLLLFCLREKK